jgi:hypothetical protein
MDRKIQALMVIIVMIEVTCKSVGRAVAQAVSRWLLTAAARVRVRAACGVCGGQRSSEAGFLRVLLFPLPNIISFNVSIIIFTRGWHNRPVGGHCAEWTQLDSTPPTIPIKKNYL